MTHIPNDIARCPGMRVDDEWLSDCSTCARRTSPPTDSERVWMMQPPEDAIASTCVYQIQGGE